MGTDPGRFGLYVRNADAVTLENVRFDLRPDAPPDESRPPVFGIRPDMAPREPFPSTSTKARVRRRAACARSARRSFDLIHDIKKNRQLQRVKRIAVVAGLLPLALVGSACAAVVTVPDAPFGKLEITAPEFAARDFPITALGAREGVKATERLYYWCSTNAPMEARRLLALDRAHMRPHLIQFNRCGNVLLDGFRIRESPFWMIHLYHSENCVVRNLDTSAHGHNNDGVDVDMTKNVLIENCRFDQGDDSIVLKAGHNADAWRLGRCTENVVVRDCDMVKSHSLLGIGSELSGGVRNVWMTRCRVADTFSMLRIKTGPRRGGFVENVWMDRCTGEKTIRGFSIFTSYCAQWGRFPDFALRRTRIRNVNVSACTAQVADYGVQLEGDPLLPPRGIRVKDVTVGRVVKKFADVANCEDVRFDGFSLASEGSRP